MLKRTTMAVVFLLLLIAPASPAYGSALNVYRFYNVWTGTHFYTADPAERANVLSALGGTYHYDGIAYTVDTSSTSLTQGLHRFYSVRSGTHFYTASDAEKNDVIARLSSTFRYEGVAYRVSPAPVAGAAAVYRFYRVRTGTHFYTVDADEKARVIATMGAEYHYEGVAYYVPLTAPAPVTTPLVWQHKSGGGYLDMIFDPCPVFSGNTPSLYTMELYAGHRYKIDSNMVAGGTGKYSYVELVAPDGSVTSPESYSFGVISGYQISNDASHIFFVPTTTGTYTFRLSPVAAFGYSYSSSLMMESRDLEP
jgi:hypothetical protein